MIYTEHGIDKVTTPPIVHDGTHPDPSTDDDGGEAALVALVGMPEDGQSPVFDSALGKHVPKDVGGGIITGTPGNWSHAFVTEAGGTFVLGAHSPDVEPLGTGKYLRVLVAGGFVRGQATVVVAGYVTAYLDCRVSLDGGATWETDLLGLRVPLRDAAGEIGTNGFTQAVGFAVAVDPAFVGEVLLDAVVVGGDDTTVPEIQNFIVESTSAEPPPADGEDEPITPGVPTEGLLAVWELTEGSGQTVANKSPGVGTADLIIGTTTGSETADVVWTSSPRRLQSTPYGVGLHKIAHYPSMPSVAAGFAVFFYMDLTTFGGADKYLCAIAGGATNDHRLRINNPARTLTARVVENSGGGGGTPRETTTTTTFADGAKAVVGFVHDGTTLGVYVNPVDGLPESTIACSAALEPGGRYFVIGAGDLPIPTSLGGPDSWLFGDTYVHAGSSILAVSPADRPAAIAALYQHIKLTYGAAGSLP